MLCKAADCQESGLLLAFTRPRSPTYLNDYHDWYNTEHRPAHLNLGFIENGYRYREKNDPSIWAVMYDLTQVAATTDSQCTNLRKHTYLREQIVVQNVVDIIEQKVYKHISTRGQSSGPAPIMTCVSFVVKKDDVDEVHRWYEQQHIEDLSRIPGWRRSRRFELVEGDVLSDCVELLAIHDFDQENGLGGQQHMLARHRPWRERIVQLAKFRANREFAFCHEFRAEDYNAPPDTATNLASELERSLAERRSSIVSGFDHGGSALNNVGFDKTVLPQVY